jgi:hypothetical protein
MIKVKFRNELGRIQANDNDDCDVTNLMKKEFICKISNMNRVEPSNVDNNNEKKLIFRYNNYDDDYNNDNNNESDVSEVFTNNRNGRRDKYNERRYNDKKNIRRKRIYYDK